jgi:hypothetical protein
MIGLGGGMEQDRYQANVEVTVRSRDQEMMQKDKRENNAVCWTILDQFGPSWIPSFRKITGA